MRGIFPCIVAAVVAVVCALPAAAQTDIDHRIPPGYEPEQGPDEQGLWMEVEEYEKAIRRSALRVDDPDLNNYVAAIVCRVAAEYCRDFRVYLIRNPGFNASMTPTGVMQIWTGLLLRSGSSDEVAAVVGHEIAHYTRLHTLERLRSIKRNSAAGSIFDIGVAIVTGVSVPVGQLTALLSALSFSREQETEADFLGTRLVADAGYDPHAAYRIWRNVIAEEEAAEVKREQPGIFGATHPDAAERAAGLEAWITTTWGPREDFEPSVREHLDVLERSYLTLMEDQIDTNRFGRSEALLTRHADMGIDPALIHYYYGEMYRQRGAAGDEASAIDAYRRSLDTGRAPPEAFRNLGYLYLKSGEASQAAAHFRRYLEARPDATDRAMIEFYLEDMS